MQALLGAVVVLLGAGAAGTLWAAAAGGGWLLVATAAFLTAVLAYLVTMLVRLPGAHVAVDRELVYFRFPGAVDAAVPRSNVRTVAVANHRWWQGLGIRTDLMGTVMLATATGPSPQFEFAEPLRVWVIPSILPIRARRLRVSVRDPERLVSLFAAVTPPGTPIHDRS